MPPIRVGFVGYGGSVKNYHLPYLLPNPEFEVCAFLQRSAPPSDPTTAKPGSHCTVDFPRAKHHQTTDTFFADEDIELVIVCTHPDSHADFAEKALNAHKHVVVEKPFTATSQEAEKLIALAKEKGKLLTVYQNRRWDGDFLTLQHLVSKDALGTITEAEIHYDFENPPWLQYMSDKTYTPGSGHMFGLGSHTIDQAILLFGRPRSVTCFLRNQRGIESEIEDTFTLILQYDSQLLVTVKTAIVTPMKDQLKYFVRGTKGSYIKFGTDAQEEQHFAGIPSTDPSFGIENPSTNGILTTYHEFDGQHQVYDPKTKKYSGAYPGIPGRNRGYYEHIADVLLRRTELTVQPQQALDAIRVMELARDSHTMGKTVPWS